MKEQFNIEKYNRLVAEGKTPRIVTRDGRDVRILCTDKIDEIRPIVALVKESDTERARFYSVDGEYGWDDTLDLIFADPEPTYRPYKDADECFKDAVKHGGWVKEKNTKSYFHLVIINDDRGCYIEDVYKTFQEMLNENVWADDGSPCGVKEA